MANEDSKIGKQALQLGVHFAPTARSGNGVNSFSNSGGVLRIVTDTSDPAQWGKEAAEKLRGSR